MVIHGFINHRVIGLYMSRNIIEKNMGGELTVSNIDNGAQFRIELGKS
jgi:signal transduction histidine kinase